MLQESPRIAQLRRRVHADPASIAFAQLAEEYRRAGHYHEAVKYCRTGLARHPGYLSARVTLGRSLIELDELDDATREFELVLRSAPDNLTAIRGMAEIHQRRGAMAPALEFYKRALTLARFDPELEESVNRIVREMGQVGTTLDGLSFEEATTQLLSAASRLPASTPPHDAAASDPGETGPSSGEPLIDFDALLVSLGAPDASPPPVTALLLSGSLEVPVLTEPLLPAVVAAASADPFAALERDLQAFEERPAAQHASEPTVRTDLENAAAMVDRRVVQELEAWLQALGGSTGPSQTA